MDHQDRLPTSAEAEEARAIESAKEAFHTDLDELAHQLPEVAEDYPYIKSSGEALIENYHIPEEFFEDPIQIPVFFAALAQCHSLLEATPDLTDSDYEQGHQFIHDVLRHIAPDHAVDGWEEIAAEFDSERLTEEHLHNTYDYYTNPALTTEIRKIIQQEGALDAIREFMGYTLATEAPYELRVLDITITGSESPEIRAKTSAFLHATNTIRPSVGWVDLIGDTTYLILTRDTAMKTLGLTRRNLQTLQHEYVHTQPSQLVYGCIGNVFEEQRAELFRLAANKSLAAPHVYQSFDNFITQVEVVTGADINQRILATAQNHSAKDFYVGLAQDLELQGMLNATLVRDNYYSQGLSPSQQRIMAYTNNMDGALLQLYLERKGDPAQLAAMEARTQAYQQQLQEHKRTKALHPKHRNMKGR